MRLRSFILVAILARSGLAQAPDTSHRASVFGTLRDSLAARSLAGAHVQLVGLDPRDRFSRAVVADSLGRYSIEDVPDGRYVVGFFHPLLDSLFLEPPLRLAQVIGQRSVEADLAVPSAATLRSVICGRGVSENDAVIVGVAHDARSLEPIGGVDVTAEWMELVLTRRGLTRNTPHRSVTTHDNGWFAICNAPASGTVTLVAIKGADSTDRVAIATPASGFTRRELFLGAAPHDTSPAAADAASPPARGARAGNGRLSGRVLGAADGRPLNGAQVRVTDGPQTYANERGEWTLTGVPEGTRRLEVRAIGYYPVERPVDVIDGAPRADVELSTMKAVLDTIRVTSTLNAKRNHSGFDERRHSGQGRYLDTLEIARRSPLVTSDLFRNQAGLRLLKDSTGMGTLFQMRDDINNWCFPAIFLDGQYISGAFLSAEDMDDWVEPGHIAGIEVYTGPGVPVQYREALNGCGSILIWTKRGSRP